MTASFDLSSYFERIGYDGPVAPTLDVLHRLHLLHPQAIPFENLDPFSGARVALDASALVSKLVARRRGGYCFEQNRLFYMALTAIGFQVTPLIARVRWQRPDDVATPLTHMLLRIDLDGDAWFADVGFGVVTLTAPLHHALGVRQPTPHGAFRLVAASVPDELVSEFETPQGWQPVYRFAPKRAEWVDYDVGNWYTSTHPESVFVHNVIACRVLPDGRATLVNDMLTLRDRAGDASVETLRDARAWAAHLRETMKIDVDGFDVGALFARVAGLGGALVTSSAVRDPALTARQTTAFRPSPSFPSSRRSG
ncbi:arylamine N-acetyltransferase family protein [Burkholderia guangdongensis]|uniref:arylamine N-acetyltransferase family protein n=1 Tax=Burkholderia guangdongensis TaxID=1792500 RepID=UPI0015CDE382|nr:arylamine N-acetyltransferase [Burkholderia guangdongensis]